MRFLSYLQEDYLVYGEDKSPWNQGGNDYFDIFVNPSAKEIKSIGPEVRYIIDFKHKKLYVWNSDHIHIIGFHAISSIDPKIRTAMKGDNWGYLSTGEARWYAGKLHFVYSDVGYSSTGKWFESDDSWLNQWFDKPYIETFKTWWDKQQRPQQ